MGCELGVGGAGWVWVGWGGELFVWACEWSGLGRVRSVGFGCGRQGEIEAARQRKMCTGGGLGRPGVLQGSTARTEERSAILPAAGLPDHRRGAPVHQGSSPAWERIKLTRLPLDTAAAIWEVLNWTCRAGGTEAQGRTGQCGQERRTWHGTTWDPDSDCAPGKHSICIKSRTTVPPPRRPTSMWRQRTSTFTSVVSPSSPMVVTILRVSSGYRSTLSTTAPCGRGNMSLFSPGRARYSSTINCAAGKALPGAPPLHL